MNPLKNIHDWENPKIYGINKIPGHVPIIPYDSINSAIYARRENRSTYQSLNGRWNFTIGNNTDEILGKIETGELNLEDEIDVPGNWTLQGYDRPIYTNIIMPFDNKPPTVPELNPTGVYQRTFQISNDWLDKEIRICFNGVESAFYLRVNNRWVGYSQDSRIAAEFNITPYLKKGPNTLTVVVIRWSDGSFLEDQDQWWMAGIYRDVFIYTLPKIHIRDFTVTAELDSEYKNAKWNVNVALDKPDDASLDRYRVEALLYDKQGAVVLESEPFIFEDKPVAVGALNLYEEKCTCTL